MRILAFDTNHSLLSVAILQDSLLVDKVVLRNSLQQSEALIPEIEKILQKNQLSYTDFNLITTTNGPGSFTGVRIGLVAARTMKIATGLPLVLSDCCEAIAYKYRHNSGKIFVAIDAKMEEFFCGEFLAENNQIKQMSGLYKSTIKDLYSIVPKDRFLLCGSGKEMIASELQKQGFDFVFEPEEDVIDPELLGLLAREKFLTSGESSLSFDPIYLREPRISC